MSHTRRIYKRMGYLRDQHGIMNRYMREKAHWDKHLEKTRAFISASISGQGIESVAVLGSGWLLDVPLDQLAKRFRQIYLVDIDHPPQVRKKTGRMERVELVEADLTGGAIEHVWQYTRNKGVRHMDDLLGAMQLTPPLSHINPDALISVNLLNQLDIIPCDYLEKKGFFKDGSLDRFRSLVQSFHMDWITRKPGCLVTDTTERSRDHEGGDTSKSLIYCELPSGIRSERWSWDFDTRGTYRPGIRTTMEVQAVEWA